MTLRRQGLAALLLTGGLLAALLPLAGAADDKKAADSADDSEPNQVIDVSTTAYKTADFGRDNKSPEALVAAAIMLRSLKTAKMEPIDVKPTDKDGKAIEVKALALRSFADEADDLFLEASALAAQLKIPRFDAFIDAAKMRNTRDVVGGAKCIRRKIGPGQWEVFHVRMLADKKATFGISASEPVKFQVVRDDVQNVWVDGTYKHHTHSGHPGGKKGQQAPFGISIHNPHNKPVEYTLTLR